MTNARIWRGTIFRQALLFNAFVSRPVSLTAVLGLVFSSLLLTATGFAGDNSDLLEQVIIIFNCLAIRLFSLFTLHSSGGVIDSLLLQELQ